MVLLRICLSLAILAGIGVIVLSQVVLKPQIEGIITTREDNKKGWDKAEGERKKTAKDLAETRVILKGTEESLDNAKTQLAAAEKLAREQEELAKARQGKIDSLTKQLKAMDDDLQAYKGSGYTPEQIAVLGLAFR